MSDGNYQISRPDVQEQAVKTGDAMAMLLAIEQYNCGNICIEQLDMVHRASNASLPISPPVKRKLEEFKESLTKSKDDN